MIKMKYLLAGFSCAALLALAPTPQVSASTIQDSGSVDVEFGKQSLTVDAGDNNKIYVAFPTVDTKDGKTIKKEGTWTSYTANDNNIVEIDLSSQKFTKGLYVAIKGNVDSDVAVYKFDAQGDKLKVTTDKSSGAVTVKQGKSEKALTKNELEYATTNGNWYPYSELDTAKYQDGATLRIRKVATGDAIEEVAADKALELNGNKVATFSVDTEFASPEAKLKIAKLKAKAKITADYATHTVTVKNATKKEVWVADSTAKTITDGSGNLDAILVSGGAVEAWGDGEKHTVFAFDAKPTLSLSTVELKSEKDSKDKLNLTITNKSKSNDIDVFVDASASKTSLAADTAKKDYKTVKADKSLTIKNVTDKSLIFIRSSANKKTLTWSSDFRIAGAVSGAAIDYSKVSDDPASSSDSNSSNGGGNNGGNNNNDTTAQDNTDITADVDLIKEALVGDDGGTDDDNNYDLTGVAKNGTTVSIAVPEEDDQEYLSVSGSKVVVDNFPSKGMTASFTVTVSKGTGTIQTLKFTVTSTAKNSNATTIALAED